MVADRGLCGGYNTMVLPGHRAPAGRVRGVGIEWRLFTVGKKAQCYFRFRGQPVERSFTGICERPTFADARAGGRRRAHPVRGRRGGPGGGGLHPLPVGRHPEGRGPPAPPAGRSPRREPGSDEATAPAAAADGAEGPQGYTEFEPDAAILLETLAPRAAEAEIFGALLEASASELTARQRAMAAATDNAGELIKSTRRIMNRARQDTITTEIMEIVGGAEALRAGADDDEGGLVIETI